MFAQIVVNHSNRTAFVSRSYTTEWSAKRGAKRVATSQGDDTLSKVVFPVRQMDAHLALAAQFADTIIRNG